MADNIGYVSSDQRKFTMVYHDFLDSDILDGKEKIIYILLKRYLDLGSDKGQVFPKIQTLMKQSGMSKGTVTNIIKNLKNKGILQVKRRGLNKSNIYTLFDYADIWKCKSKDEITQVIEDKDIQKAAELLQKNGFEIIKREPITETDQSTEISPRNYQYYSNDNTISVDKSQDRYSLEWIKDHFEYNILINDYSDRVIEWDYVIEIIYDICNSSRRTIKVSSEDKTINIVISRLLKLNYTNIIYAVDQVKKQTNKIHNPRAYMISALYNSIDAEIATINQVSVDMSEGKI
jgi:predicted transcriptional regulator